MHIFHKKLNLKKEKRNKKENKTKNRKNANWADQAGPYRARGMCHAGARQPPT
jgi:hypothetical protein